MLLKKMLYNAKIKNIEDKIRDITNAAANTSLNAKINEVKGEIPSITIHNRGKSVVAERSIRTLKNTIYKYMTSISKNMYINKICIAYFYKKLLSKLVRRNFCD